MFRRIATALACLVALGGVSMTVQADNRAPDALPKLTLKSWADFKLSCEHPAHFNRQVPAVDIKIFCGHQATVWLPDSEGPLTLGQSRRISGALESSKYDINRQDFEVPIPPSTVYCPRFREVLQTYSTMHEVTCDEALADKSTDLGELCLRILDEDLGQNMKLIKQEDTGRFVDTCQGPSPKVK